MINIESSLVCIQDCKKEFVHDTYLDSYLARWFATRINDGRLTVEQCWKDYWSYEENAELWDLPKDREWRVLLPAYRKIILRICESHCSNFTFTTEMLNSLILNYKNAKNCLADQSYNPFITDFELYKEINNFDAYYCPSDSATKNSNHTIKSLKVDTKDHYLTFSSNHTIDQKRHVDLSYMNEQIANIMNDMRTTSFAELTGRPKEISDDIDERIKSIKFLKRLFIDNYKKIPDASIEKEILFLLYDDEAIVRACAVDSLGECNYFTPEMIHLLYDTDPMVKTRTIEALARMGRFHEGICDALDEKNPSVVNSAVVALGILKHYDSRLMQIVENNSDTSYICKYALANIFKDDKENTYNFLTQISKKKRFAKDDDKGDLILILHESLKPKGYNPPIKKLLTQ